MVEAERRHIVNVHIGGSQYSVVSQPSEDGTIQAIARYVDEKLKTVSQKTASTSSHQLAILAALNIAEEYFQFAKKQRMLRKELQKRLELLLKVIDNPIPPKEQKRKVHS